MDIVSSTLKKKYQYPLMASSKNQDRLRRVLQWFPGIIIIDETFSDRQRLRLDCSFGLPKIDHCAGGLTSWIKVARNHQKSNEKE
jgi:hypothetical protein